MADERTPRDGKTMEPTPDGEEACPSSERGSGEIVGKDPRDGRQTGAEEPTAPMDHTPAPVTPSTKSLLPAPPPAAHQARVLSVHVQTLIRRRIARAGIPEHRREDFQQDITVALLYMASPPDDLEGCSRAAHDIAGKQIAGDRRQDFRRARSNVGPTDEADQHAQESATDRASAHYVQQAAAVREALEDGTLSTRDAEMLVLKHEGHTDATIAAKVGVKPQTVSNRLAIVRSQLREKWQARMATFAALTLAVLAILAWSQREEIASFFRAPPPPVPAPAPTQPVPEPSIPVATQAGELRRQAGVACEKRDYSTCSDRLEAAAKLDPAGETQPRVRELRHTVEDHIRFERENNSKAGGRR